MKKRRKRKFRVTAVLALLIIVILISFYKGEKFLEKESQANKVTAVQVDKDKEISKSSSEVQVNTTALANKPNDVQAVVTKPDSVGGTEEKNDKSKDNPSDKNKDSENVGKQNDSNKKIAHLTFDDGPTATVTPYVLDVLKKYNIKATFFVIGSMAEKNKDLLKREYTEGHMIANHTYSHDYKIIYSNPETFMQDLLKADGLLKSLIPGYDYKIIRFPGGSFGEQRKVYRQAVEKAGFRYIDWNSLSGDAEAVTVPVDKLLENVKKTSQGKNNITILMHDAPLKETTPQALPNIIDYLISQGYSFELLK